MEAPESLRGENLNCPKCGYLEKVSGENTDLMKPLGNFEPICPYCNNLLEIKPKRRSKCPNCGNYFRIRTRPQDRKQVLVTEEEAEEIEKQYRPGYGREPENLLKENQQQWDKRRDDLNIQSTEYAKAEKWWLYRNSRYELAKILSFEASYILENLEPPKDSEHGIRAVTCMKQALKILIGVSLFDLNGVKENNEFKPMQTRVQLWDMGSVIIDSIIELVEKLNLQRINLKQIFYEIAETYKSIPFPLSTDEAWKRFKEAFDDYDIIVATNKNNQKYFNNIQEV